MPRRARIVVPGVPHLVRQRGSRGQDVFFDATDRLLYLRILQEYSEKYNVAVLAFCLLRTEVSLLLVPKDAQALSRTLKMVHMNYAAFINQRCGWSGHLWQSRYFSSPLDMKFFWIALRYIERRPVEVGIVEHPAYYQWSSAPLRCEVGMEPYFIVPEKWQAELTKISKWQDWLGKQNLSVLEAKLIAHLTRDLPCGGRKFVAELEERYGRVLRIRPRGRPPKLSARVSEFGSGQQFQVCPKGTE